MKGINEWAKDLKHNEKVAKQFEGVKSVQDILKVAKENGYEFSEEELMDFDLDSVAGGGRFGSFLSDAWGAVKPLAVDVVKPFEDAGRQVLNDFTCSTGDSSGVKDDLGVD